MKDPENIVDSMNDENHHCMPPQPEIRRFNWQGSVPVVVTLAQTSLSSPSLPSPIYKLLSRQAYPHLGLANLIRRLSNYAVTPLGSSGDCLIDTWFEDEDTGLPLKWQLPAGVLYDLLHKRHSQSKQQHPWKLKLHFSSYPKNQILSLSQGMTTIQKYYFNQLKQSLFVQHGSSKTQTREMTKSVHEKLWDSLCQDNFELYEKISQSLRCNIYETPKNIQSTLQDQSESPIKEPVPEDSPAPIDDPETTSQEANVDGKELSEQEPSVLKCVLSFGGLTKIPVRVYLDVDKPPIQRPFSATITKEVQEESRTTLGDLFLAWLPQLFKRSNDGDISHCCAWAVQGIQPPLQSPLADLWHNFCHPDLFLYITVII